MWYPTIITVNFAKLCLWTDYNCHFETLKLKLIFPIVHPEKGGRIGSFWTFEILVSVCNELEWKSVNRSEVLKPCNSEIADEPPHSCIIGTILVHSFTVVSGGGIASKHEFSGGDNVSTAEMLGVRLFLIACPIAIFFSSVSFLW